MKVRSYLILIVILFSTSSLVAAEDSDPASQEALLKTQELLTDQAARAKAIEADPKAQTADQQVNRLSCGDAKVTEEIYGLASQVFGTVVKESNGDPAKMKEAMEAYSRDPASFAAQWTSEQKALLEKLSTLVNSDTTQPPVH